LAACGGPPQSPTPGPAGDGAGQAAAPPASQSPLRLVVLLVIDQLPSWTFDRDRTAFGHGLGRLVRDGAYYPVGELPYANTYTATGHAALATGAPPAVTGIVGNSWYDSTADVSRRATEDPERSTFAILPRNRHGAG